MAEAIQQKANRDAIAIAERRMGAGSRSSPTPRRLFDDHGQLTGAINILIDVTDEQSESLHDQAERCRRLADATYDRETNKVLGEMARSFDNTADGLADIGRR